MSPERVARLLVGLYEWRLGGSDRVTLVRATKIVKELHGHWHVPVRFPDVEEWKKLALKFGNSEHQRLVIEAFKIREETVV